MPPRSTRAISTRTSGKPSLPGSARSHSGSAPAAINAPSTMSPLIPAAGSRMAKRRSIIDLKYRPIPALKANPALRHRAPPLVPIEPARSGIEDDDVLRRFDCTGLEQPGGRPQTSAPLRSQVEPFQPGDLDRPPRQLLIAHRDCPAAGVPD